MSNGSTESVGRSKVTDDTAKLDRKLTKKEKEQVREQVQEAVEQVGRAVAGHVAPPGTVIPRRG
jgi:hypothetical protein